MCSGRRWKEQTGLHPMGPAMIKTIIVAGELSFLMGALWILDATRLTGTRSEMVRHFSGEAGARAPITGMGRQCCGLPTAVWSRLEMASPTTSPDTARRSTLLWRFHWK